MCAWGETAWQAMDSAPRDGTAILLAIDGEARVGRWFQADPDAIEGPDDISGWYCLDIDSAEQPAPSPPLYWSPMPVPPPLDEWLRTHHATAA